MRIIIGLLLSSASMSLVFRSNDFMARRDNWAGGFIIGTLIIGAYILSGGPLGELANEASDFSDMPQNGMGTQSYTFIRPMGDLLYIASNPEWYILTFGLVAFLGVGAGPVFISIVSSRFKIFGLILLLKLYVMRLVLVVF